jgi:hypothetical protein
MIDVAAGVTGVGAVLVADEHFSQKLLIFWRELGLVGWFRQRPTLLEEHPGTGRTGSGDRRTGLAKGDVLMWVFHQRQPLLCPLGPFLKKSDAHFRSANWRWKNRD